MLSAFKIGHYTNLKNGTGCTVIVPPEGNIASAAVRGASPGTRELALLAPDKKISSINALVLTGGSAFGLNAAQGVMEALAKKGRGYHTEYGPVPIVPAAVIFDKNVGDPSAFPSSGDAVRALNEANGDFDLMGNIGAGTGATVGKWRGMDYAMKGGLGSAKYAENKLEIVVVSVVNAVGDIRDWDGKILAGARDGKGGFAAQKKPFFKANKPQVGLAENTILSAVLMNARISKLQAHYLAERVHFGIARRVEPSHTSYDGDVAFVISYPGVQYDLDLLAAAMIHTVEASLLNAARSAESAYGLSSCKDMEVK